MYNYPYAQLQTLPHWIKQHRRKLDLTQAELADRYLAPELVLLYKSRSTSGSGARQRSARFRAGLPVLEPERRAWLRWALVATAPEHPWLGVLAEKPIAAII